MSSPNFNTLYIFFLFLQKLCDNSCLYSQSSRVHNGQRGCRCIDLACNLATLLPGRGDRCECSIRMKICRGRRDKDMLPKIRNFFQDGQGPMTSAYGPLTVTPYCTSHHIFNFGAQFRSHKNKERSLNCKAKQAYNVMVIYLAFCHSKPQ